jgi:uncharacterized lipoprotein YddW (UPF0748 family)
MVHSVDFMMSDATAAVRRGPARRRAAVLGCALMLTIAASIARAEPRELRAFAVPASALDSPAAARRAVTAAAESKHQVLLVPLPLGGVTPEQERALDALAADAHAHGLRVHAAVQPIAATGRDELPAARSHIIYRSPEWLMVPRELALELSGLDSRSPEYLGRLTRWTRANADRVDALYLSPLQPEAVDHMAAAVARLVARFALDGIHLDGLRYPGPDFDYGRRALDLFRSAIGAGLPAAERARLDAVQAIDPFGYAEDLADTWRQFRVSRLTGLVARLRTAAHSARPGIVISAGVIGGADKALESHLQDWRTWLDNRFVDALADTRAGGMLLFSYDTLVHTPGEPALAPAPAAAGSQ